MYGESKPWRYIIGLGLVIVLLFVIIFMIVHSGGHKQGKVPETKKALTSYASNDNATVTETIIGPITSPQTHSEARITVSNTSSSIDLIRGYDGNVIDTHQYSMTVAAFEEFLSALDKIKFTSGNTDPSLSNDKGYCATGQRYVFEIHDGSHSIQRFWATSCSGTKTYRGDLSKTVNLFQAQIPDYDSIIKNTSFNTNLWGM